MVGAEDEIPEAEAIATPLREAGYDVRHLGTLRIGDSILGSLEGALQRGVPIVFAATRAAMGDVRCQAVVNAARAKSSNVFIVRMHPRVALGAFEADRVVADYSSDPQTALNRLVNSVRSVFPVKATTVERESQGGFLDLNRPDFLDQSVENMDVDLDTLRDVGLPANPEDQHSLNKRLATLGLMRQGRLTLAGLLVLGSAPQEALPSARVQCFAYDGVDVTAAVSAREHARGNIIQQISLTLSFVAGNAPRHEALTPGSGRSEVATAYPEQIVREAIANALVHRDYSMYGQVVHVNLFRDRLCISSPGTWVQEGILGEDPSELQSVPRRSDARNPRLSSVLSELGYVEGQGSGLPKIVKGAQAAGARNPAAQEIADRVEITLYPDSVHDPVPEKLRFEAALAWEFTQSEFGQSRRPDEWYVARRLVHGSDARLGEATSPSGVLASGGKFTAILGPPMSGKSVLMRRLVYEATAVGITPMLVEASRYPGGDVEKWVAAEVSSTAVSAKDALSVLRSQSTLLAIDGFDEIRDDEARREFSTWLIGFQEESPELRVVISSRPLAVIREPWIVNADVYTLDPFNQADVMAILDRQSAVGVSNTPWIRRALEVLGGEFPMLLAAGAGTTLAGVGAVAALAVSELVQRERRKSGLEFPPTHALFAVLAELAMGQFLVEPYSSNFQRSDVEATVRAALDDPVEAQLVRRHLLTGRDPLLIPIADGDGYSFSHRAIAEFFAVEWILRERFPDGIVDVLIDLVVHGESELAWLTILAAEERTTLTRDTLLTGLQSSVASREEATQRQVGDFVKNRGGAQGGS